MRRHILPRITRTQPNPLKLAKLHRRQRRLRLTPPPLLLLRADGIGRVALEGAVARGLYAQPDALEEEVAVSTGAFALFCSDYFCD
jgi:hypothetical protein